MINMLNLSHHPENPRKNIGDITELTESIKKNGVMQNLTVIPAMPKAKDYYCDDEVADFEKDPDKHTYLVIIGNRRMEAAKAAGVK
ncbi:MAG: ParB/Srx family N-terminal domain-containing protein, partial [Lachnospiraceae bacterium]|nr:ParB/Srx family N-terminal domain-containing protein [Lachnospiraceae bacterium]